MRARFYIVYVGTYVPMYHASMYKYIIFICILCIPMYYVYLYASTVYILYANVRLVFVLLHRAPPTPPDRLARIPIENGYFFSTVLHILKFSPEILDLNRRQNLIQCNVFLTFMYNKSHVTEMYIFSIGNFFRNIYYKYSNFINISLVKNTFFFFFFFKW